MMDQGEFEKAILAGRALLDQLAKQEHGEPVAWCRYEDGMWVYYETKAWDDLQPLYTTPPQGEARGLSQQQRKPLTDEQRNWIVATCPTPRHIIDAVERMHCIKE
jgi:hypothetical protein